MTATKIQSERYENMVNNNENKQQQTAVST